MILSIRANNYLVYSNEIELSLRANKKIRRMNANTVNLGKLSILKAVGIYGANNAGKTCLIRAIHAIKCVMLSCVADVSANLFTNNPISSFGIDFTEDDRVFRYNFKFNSKASNELPLGFIYEEFAELKIDKYGNETWSEVFIRDVGMRKYKFPAEKAVEDLMKSVSSNNILIYPINTEKFKKLDEIKKRLRTCAENIEIVDLNNIPIEKTIDLLKDKSSDKSKIVELIKDADVDVQDYYYKEPNIIRHSIQPINNVPQEVVLRAQNLATDMFCLMSNHRGKIVPSFIFDSTGTKKIVALASYVVEALEKGKTLVVDELDSSLHFKLTRAIVALFNNELNTEAQLIFTLHDISLLDCKTLFRKDQIWFASKDKDTAYLYSLDNFTAREGIRADSSDIAEQYRKGIFGAIPDPDLINVLLKEKANAKK